MIRSGKRSDLGDILEIYNDVIVNTTAVYDYGPHSLEDRIAWFEKKITDGYPLLVYEENNSVIGYASYGAFRDWPAYKYTVEHSVHIHKDHRGKRIGTRLMTELIRRADDSGYATMVAAIDASNEASIIMHKQLGFALCGTVKKAGFKFGKWLDLAFYQYALKGPNHPEDG
jgi:L-amino acid N-acyltransferase